MQRNWVEITTSLVGGAGLGAALMYLFDPDKGHDRRDHLADRTHDALESTGEAVGGAWHSLADKARDVGGHIADYSGAAYQGAKETAGRWASSAADTARGWAGSARDQAGDWMDDARGWGSKKYQAARKSYGRGVNRAAHALGGEQEGFGYGGMTMAALCALGLGAGLMFLLDPTAGRRRRAVVRDKTASAARQTGNYVSRTAQDLGNRATGVYHEVADKVSNTLGMAAEVSDPQLESRVRTELGRAGRNLGKVTVQVANGKVTLAGSAAPSDVEGLLSAIRAVPGVKEVVNNLSAQQSSASL